MRRMFVLACSFAAVALTACGSDGSTAPTPASVAGTWNLTTINGSPLPFVLQALDPKVEILSDQITASSNGTFSDTYQFRFTQGTTVTTQTATDVGTYTLNGTAVSFIFSDGSSATGTISGNTITVAESGFSSVYKKQ
jgi:hypothetical protein